MLPPFAPEDSLVKIESLPANNQETAAEDTLKRHLRNLPVVFQNKENKTVRVWHEGLREYLEWELDVSRLNDVHKWLWLAGRPMCARPLYKQKLLDREILVTEQIDIHLLWTACRIFIKPLPEFLMDHGFWTENLCGNPDTHKSACGLLLSYTWLVCHQSDFKIAKDHCLLPDWMTWTQWLTFTRAFLDAFDNESLSNVNERYTYGELRMDRINWIYRLTFRNFMRGYEYRYNRFSVFLRLNFAWLAVVFLYITVVLSAMQVGLSTDRLKGSSRFQDASYGFTVFSILTPLIVVSFVAVVLMVLVFYNFSKTVVYKKKVEKERGQTRQNGIPPHPV